MPFLSADFFLALVLVLLLVLLAFDLLDLVLVFLAVVLLALDLPGKARQCALVFLPFLSTDALRQVHVSLTEQTDLANPEHWLLACVDTEKPTAIIMQMIVSIIFLNMCLAP